MNNSVKFHMPTWMVGTKDMIHVFPDEKSAQSFVDTTLQSGRIEAVRNMLPTVVYTQNTDMLKDDKIYPARVWGGGYVRRPRPN